MRYAAQQILTDPARPAAELWRLLLGVVLIVALFLAMGFAYFNVLAGLVTQDDWPRLNAEIDAGSTPRGMMALLGSFGFVTLSLWLVLSQLHRRPLATLFGPLGRALRDFSRVGLSLTALAVLLWLLPEPALMKPQPNLAPLRWLALLPLGLALVVIQISAEELFFRGYLQSQLSARFSQPLIWLLVPSLLFGVLHFDPETQGGNAGIFVVTAALFGLAAADLTARSGTLGAALALHLWINVSALLVTAPLGNLFGLALQTFPFALDDTSARVAWLPYDTLVLLCSWLAARLALSR